MIFLCMTRIMIFLFMCNCDSLILYYYGRAYTHGRYSYGSSADKLSFCAILIADKSCNSLRLWSVVIYLWWSNVGVFLWKSSIVIFI